jgi:signal transduction histidine kinase
MPSISIPSRPHEAAAGGRWAERQPDPLLPLPGASGRVDLVDLARASQGAFAPLAQVRRISCVLDAASGPHAVTGDRRLLLRLTVDLLSSAFRVTPDGGRVVLAVWRCAGDELLQVRASGAGVASDPLADVPGPGSGDPWLALLRQAAAAHGGWAGAHSAGVDQGTTFTVGLPALRG